MTARGQRGARSALELRRYVAGDAPNSVLARSNLEASLAHLPASEVSVQIVDVLRDPERALRDRIFAAPMLVRVAPAPARRIIGSLRDPSSVRGGLGMDGGRS